MKSLTVILLLPLCCFGQNNNNRIPQASPTKSAISAPTLQHSVSLNWSESTTGCTFNIYRSTISGGYYSQIATGVTNQNYRDSNVTSGTTYYYVVIAILNGSSSSYSNQIQAIVP